jgi:ParB-like chromosome segregation protein Spo0J
VDVERTIEFILKTEARTDVRLAGITKLIQQGMRMLVKNEAAIAKNEAAIAQLAEAQKRTDAKLAETAARTDAKLAETAARTDARLAQMAARTDAKFAEMAEAHKELALEMKELAKAQKQTERSLRAFIQGQRNGRNGR